MPGREGAIETPEEMAPDFRSKTTARTRSVAAGHAGAKATAVAGVELRRMPFPYRAMLSICSDLDETPDARCYLEIARFLNTTGMTAMGPGVGLEVGNTIYFDMPPGQFAYWSTDDAGRAIVRDMIKSGHIDALHSFGDLADTRAHAGRALDELARHGCRLKLWIDHAIAPSNFGADIMRGQGDVPGSPVYHADITTGYGIEYVWRGRITSVIGQDVPRSLGGILSRERSLRSAKTLAKELAKGLLARLGHEKYAMHAPNAVLRKARLRDGRPVLEFLRMNPFVGGVEKSDTADGIADVLTQPVLDRLVEREGMAIVYTHLGKVRSADVPFGEATGEAFRRLAESCTAERILVATTRRLLDYRRARDAISYHVRREGQRVLIDVTARAPHDVRGALAGITFYTAEPARTDITVNGRRVIVERNGPDGTGRRSVSIPWPRLEFPIP